MQLSAKTQNACLALLELAKHYSNPHPVCLKSIADEQQISSQFLVQILLQLKRAGMVSSTRGASGGYRLARPPAEISLLDIVIAMEGESTAPRATDNPIARVLRETWSNAVDEHQQRLAEISLEVLLSSVQSGDMYYI